LSSKLIETVFVGVSHCGIKKVGRNPGTVMKRQMVEELMMEGKPLKVALEAVGMAKSGYYYCSPGRLPNCRLLLNLPCPSVLSVVALLPGKRGLFNLK